MKNTNVRIFNRLVIYITFFSIIIISGTVSFADSKPSNEVSYDIISELGKSFELKQGQAVFIKSENIYVKLDKIAHKTCKDMDPNIIYLVPCVPEISAEATIVRNGVESGTYKITSSYQSPEIPYNVEIKNDPRGAEISSLGPVSIVVAKKQAPVCTPEYGQSYWTGTKWEQKIIGSYWKGWGSVQIGDKDCIGCAAVCKYAGTDKEGWYTSDGCASLRTKNNAGLIILETCQVPVIVKSTEVSYIELPEDNIQMADGWNLISPPYSDSIIVSTNCDVKSIYHYNALSGKWDEKFTDLGQMKSGVGYFVKVSSKCAITFSASSAAPVKIGDIGDEAGKLKKGWNMISGTTETINLIENKGSCDIKAVYGYNTQQAGYDTNTQQAGYDTDAGTGKYYKTEKIEKGKGYWVYAKEDCHLRFDLKAVVVFHDTVLGDVDENSAFIETVRGFVHVDKAAASQASAGALKNYDAMIIPKKYKELSQDVIVDIANSGIAVALISDAKEYANDVVFDSNAFVEGFD